MTDPHEPLSASPTTMIHSDVSTSSALADIELENWIAEVRADPGPSCAAIGVQALRAGAEARAKSRPSGPELLMVRDLSTDTGLSVRLYRPALEEKPLVIYLHGGGFVIGDLNSHDGICRRLAFMADVSVLAVDYRRAPEYPSPAAVDDAVSAFTWATEHLSELGGSPKNGIALAGDSAGGAIALLAAARLVECSTSPSALFLGYPNADMTLSQPSIIEKGHGWSLDAADLAWGDIRHSIWSQIGRSVQAPVISVWAEGLCRNHEILLTSWFPSSAGVGRRRPAVSSPR